MNQIDNLSINSIRILSADAIQKANSGHPGLPLGCAAIGYEVWANQMNHNPANPGWANRDRFVLSGGHGSMLLYSLLHLFGYGGLSKEDLMNFRQLGSRTPGHPEFGHTVGVEATTGPLGAGMAMAVGMAMAEAHLESVFNKDDYPVVDHFTYVLGGDGCMMEGISSEAFSLAGTLGLSKLIVLYDSNRISIEGSTDIAFCENVEERMRAFGFQTITVENGNDTGFIEKIANVGSEGTDILVKAMINIMLLNVFKEGASRKFKDFKLHCMMDEIGKLHPNNISGILKFANDRNIILINGSPTELNRDAYKHVYLLTKGTQNKTRIARLISDKQL